MQVTFQEDADHTVQCHAQYNHRIIYFRTRTISHLDDMQNYFAAKGFANSIERLPLFMKQQISYILCVTSGFFSKRKISSFNRVVRLEIRAQYKQAIYCRYIPVAGGILTKFSKQYLPNNWDLHKLFMLSCKPNKG